MVRLALSRQFQYDVGTTSSLATANPVAFNYYYRQAATGSNNDCFVSPGGAGITYPSEYPDVDGLAVSTGESLRIADQRVVVILDPYYNSARLYRILDEPEVTGMMFKTYSDYYKGRHGALDWHNGKPIVSVKYALWDGADTAQSISAALNNSPHRDPLHDSASYSIVTVHAWSTSGPTGTGSGDPMSNLNQLVQWLDPTKVKVVTLEELMVQLRNNFGAPMDFRFDANPGNIAVSSDVFGARIVGPIGKEVVVERSINVHDWAPIKTNSLPEDGLEVSVPLDSGEKQFFRARLVR